MCPTVAAAVPEDCAPAYEGEPSLKISGSSCCSCQISARLSTAFPLALRLAFEARQSIGISGKRYTEDFQRDVALQPRVPRAPHLTHAACSERSNDLVRANMGTNA